jgi:3-oxoacyl-[acyl-carrier protein] reductase
MIFKKLAHKRVLITAGAQGIGEAISRRFIEAGCHVAIHYFSSSQRAEEIAAEPHAAGQKVIAIGGDLTNPEIASEMVNDVATQLGGIDILINNAGSIVARRRLHEIDDAFWTQIFDLNLTSMLSVTRAAAPHLAKSAVGSSIVNLASLAGRKGGHPGSLAYSTAKGAVLTWTRALSNELAPQGTRVNAIAPGLILGTSFHNTHTSKESADKTIEGIPLGIAGGPDDVARAVLYFASEYDGFITGATLDINGGVYCA